MNSALHDAITQAQAHEIAWPRNPQQDPAHFGIHHQDPEPWNRLRGPLHARGPVSGLILRHGSEIARWGEPRRSDQTFSVAKTYLALLAGVAQWQGLLPDLDRPVRAQLPGIGFDDPHNATITWRHLLQQTSEWQGSCFGLPDQVDRWRTVSNDPRPAAGPKGGARPLQAPGTYWEYNDVRINQLSLALLHLFGRPLQEVFRDTVLRPVGAQDTYAWEPYDDAWTPVHGQRMPSVPGGTHWGGGVCISAADQARVGQLLLADGWHGGHRLLPPGWVDFMGTPCDSAPFYGALVWLNRNRQVFGGAGERALFMLGAGGHITWVDPELDSVVVVRWLDSSHHASFIAQVAAALASA